MFLAVLRCRVFGVWYTAADAHIPHLPSTKRKRLLQREKRIKISLTRCTIRIKWYTEVDGNFRVVEIHGRGFKLYHSGMFGTIVYHGFYICTWTFVQCSLIVVRWIKSVHISYKRTAYDKRRKILLREKNMQNSPEICEHVIIISTRKINKHNHRTNVNQTLVW